MAAHLRIGVRGCDEVRDCARVDGPADDVALEQVAVELAQDALGFEALDPSATTRRPRV